MSKVIPSLYDFLCRNALRIALGALSLAFFTVLGWRIFLLFAHSPNLGAMETSVIYGIQRLLAGLPLYTHPGQPPFAIIQYTPLYYYLCTGAGLLAGVNPEEPLQVYFLSRSLSLALNLMSLALIWRLLQEMEVRKALAWGAVCLVFIFYEQAIYSRPDSLQSFLFLATIYSFLRYLRKDAPSVSWLFIAALSSVLAIFAKQNGILLPLILLSYLLLYRYPIRHVLYLAGAMSATAILAGLFLAGKDLGVFWLNVVKGVDNGISLSYFFGFIYDLAFKKFFLPFVAGLFLAFYWLGNKGNDARKVFLSWALLSSFGFALITGLKWGSIPSYFTDFVTLAFLALALAAGEKFDSLKAYPAFRLALLCSTLLLIPLHTSQKEWGRVLADHQKDPFREAAHLREQVKQSEWLPAGEWMFTHDFLLNLYFFRQCTFPQNDIVYCCTWPRKTYDYDAFRDGVNEGMIYLVVEKNPDSTLLAFGEVVFSRFEKAGQIGSYGVFVWQNPLGQPLHPF